MLSGGVVSLDCQATGRPKPMVSWYHGTEHLERDGRHSILSDGSLRVYDMRKTDGGNYTCAVVNVLGTVQIMHSISVDG